ncbi:MAG TPA: hypothetical protein VK524_02090 [Polyangiaceae bacterium]|nr:hypothetical protein [Polyangiaceae bacterium]
MSARIVLTAATALAVVALLGGAPGGARVGSAAAAFAVGLVAAFGIAQIGRISRDRTREQIETWNSLVKKLVAQTATGPDDSIEKSEHQ